jgi:single-strand DNA-binding protein
MAGMLKITAIGNLGRDPEKRYSQSGTPMLRFSVAATTGKKQPDGSWQDHTEWLGVTVFGKMAETLAERLQKGSKVYIEGRLETRQYESNGKAGFSLDVVASEVNILDSRRAESADESTSDEAPVAAARPSARPAAKDETVPDIEDTDLPF